MGIRLIIAILFLALPLPARAEIETYHFKGDMEMLTLSGIECADKERPGSRMPVDLALKVERNGAVERFEGYYTGPEIQTGYFSGVNSANLPLYYPEEGISVYQGHNLSLEIKGNTLGAEIHEKHLAATDNGCNFDHARLILSRVGSDDKPEVSYKHLEKRFTSESEYMLGYRKYDEGKIPESIPHLEAAVRLRDEIDGFSTQEMIYPALFLSMADCVTGRFEEGYKLQARVLGIPMEKMKRQALQHVVLINLYSDQARRLGGEGKWDQATSLIERAIAGYPDLTELQVLMAELLVEQERLEEACNMLEKAYRSHPADARLGDSLAWCLVQRGNELFDVDDPGVSLELFRHALDLNPVNRGAWGIILAAYADIGTPDEGEKLLQKRAELVISAFGKKEYERLKAYIYSEEARLAVNGIDRAKQEDLIRKAVALDPDNPVYVTKLARIIQRSGHYEESLNLLKKQRGRCKDDSCRETIDESLQKELLLERLVRKLDL